MKKLYDSADLEGIKDRTPHFHFTWAGLMVPSAIALVFISILFLLINYN